MRESGYARMSREVTPLIQGDFLERIYPALCRTALSQRGGRPGLPGLRGADWVAEIVGMGWIMYLTDLARGIANPSPGAIASYARRRVCSGGRVCHPAQARYKKQPIELRYVNPARAWYSGVECSPALY